MLLGNKFFIYFMASKLNDISRWSDHWGDATACPYIHMESCLQGGMTKKETIVRTVAETVGGVAVFK